MSNLPQIRPRATRLMRPAIVLCLALAGAMASGAGAQTRPFGVSGDGSGTATPGDPHPASASIVARLGDCPVEQLRQGWARLQSLEAVAVEEEVLRLCTERAERIALFLRAMETIDTALADSLPRPAAPPATTISDPVPEPQPRPAPPQDAPPDPGAARPAVSPEPGPPPPTVSPDIARPFDVTDPTNAAPPRPRTWHVVFVVRSGDGPWRAGLVTRRAWPLPDPILVAPAGGEPPDPGTDQSASPAPRVAGSPGAGDRDGLVLTGQGDRLDGDIEVVRIDAAGVRVRAVAAGDRSEDRLLPWAEAPGVGSPGRTEWIVTRVTDRQGGGV